MAMTLSREISLLTTVAGSPAFERSSSVRSSSFLPSTPPAEFRVSIANMVPSCEDFPKVASLPVKEANSPTLITLSPPPAWPWPGLLHPVKRLNTAMTTPSNNNCLQYFIILIPSSCGPAVQIFWLLIYISDSALARGEARELQPVVQERSPQFYSL